MNMKKILALTIIALALFSCMSVASAGWFDFFGSEPANETYNFTYFSIELPENASISNYTYTDDGYVKVTYAVTYGAEGENKSTVTIGVMTGENLVTDVDEFVSNWESMGGSYYGTYGEWTIIDVNNAPVSDTSNRTLGGYILAKHNGSNLISIRGTNLTELEHIVDTYKPI